MVPPPPPLLPLLLVSEEDDACSTNANSSLAAMAHTVCQAIKARVLSDRPLLAGHMDGKGGECNVATRMVTLAAVAEVQL